MLKAILSKSPSADGMTFRRLVIVLVYAALAVPILLNLVLTVPGFVVIFSRGHADYLCVYTGARMLVSSQARFLYDMNAQMAIQHQSVGFVNPALPFTHPPFEALAFVPLAFLPFAASLYVWVLVNILLLIVFANLMQQHLPAALRLRPSSFFWSVSRFFPSLPRSCRVRFRFSNCCS